jgi:hypothetical protein
MTAPAHADPVSRLDRAWCFALVVLLPLAVVAVLGIDGNWDLRNYHLYNPHAWLTGRELIDIAPAQQQSWHNPLLDVPMYLIIQSGADPRWASLWLALPGMASIWCLLRLQRALGEMTPTRASQAALALLAVTGAATSSTLGLSMNDSFVGAAMLGALVLVLDPRPAGLPGRHRWLFAGLVAGAMAGLKLSAYFYCIGLAAAALFGGPGTPAWRRLLALASGGLAGFLSTYGPWGWHLWATRRNPVFPYFNNLFRSPDVLPQSWTDTRFLPDSLAEALLSPFQLLTRTSNFSEMSIRDPRLLLGLLGLTLLFVLHRKRPGLGPKFAMLLAFFVVSWLGWVLQYGIYRYAIVLEALGCLALVLALQRVPRWRNAALVLGLLLVTADTKRPNWGRTHTPSPRLGIALPALPPDALVVIASQEPLAYFALGLPDSVPMIAVLNNLMVPGRCMGLQAQAEARIAGHAGPVWLLNTDAADSARAQAVVAEYGLEAGGPCLEVDSAIGPGRLCPQRRVGVGRVRSATCPRDSGQALP